MIRGLVVPEIGGVLLANLNLAGFGHVDNVLFLVDTGASHSLLSAGDAAAFTGLDFAGLAEGPELQGFGGPVNSRVAIASLSFRHIDNARTNFVVQIAVQLSVQQDVPSVLGRDVLFQGQLSIGTRGLSWDVEPGVHDLTA